jgi:hypothetical protein
MAFTYTVDTTDKSVLRGDVAIVTGTATATSVTSGEIVTGLSEVYGFSVNNNSTEKGVKAKSNVDGSGTTSAGSIGILACTSNDVMEWMAYGKP